MVDVCLICLETFAKVLVSDVAFYFSTTICIKHDDCVLYHNYTCSEYVQKTGMKFINWKCACFIRLPEFHSQLVMALQFTLFSFPSLKDIFNNENSFKKTEVLQNFSPFLYVGKAK